MHPFGSELIDLKYNGIPFLSLSIEKTITTYDDGEEKICRRVDGLQITTHFRHIAEFDAFEWQNTLENKSSKSGGLISDLWDCAVSLPLPHDDDRHYTAFLPRDEECAMLYSPNGSIWSEKEFFDEPELTVANHTAGMLFPGWKKRFTACGGRFAVG